MKRSFYRVLAGCFMLCITPFAAAEDRPQVMIETNMGNILLELNPKAAPITVENFLNYVNSGYYSNTIFHRVIKDFMIQGGGFTTDFTKKETDKGIKNEANNGLENVRGSVAMARTTVPNSATSQFFINTVNNRFLNHSSPTPRGWGYAVFAQVIDGMDVVDEIRNLKTGSGGPFRKDVPKQEVVMTKVYVVNNAESASK